MKAEIITIGDEILLGQTVDTNSAWLGENLNLIGVNVKKVVTISDERQAILDAVTAAFENSEIVLMTGGLGPTQDDITKKTLAEYFDSEFYMNESVKKRIEDFYKSIGKEPLDVNIQQAELPKKCTVLDNSRGTASGMWFEKDGKILVSMPGVPGEMKGIMKDEVLPRIQKHFKTPALYHKTLLTLGEGESRIAMRIKSIESEIRKTGLGLAYLPSAGMVKLRVSGQGEDVDKVKADVNERVEEIRKELGDLVFGEDLDSLASVVGTKLASEKLTLAIAESCTGGSISKLITSISGSSRYFQGGVVVYSNDSKELLVGVKHESIVQNGAVSAQVVEEMAEGVRLKFNSDYGIATSGIAGPMGGSELKPVGTVWIGISSKEGNQSFHFLFSKSRSRNIILTSNHALNLLRKDLLRRFGN